MCFGIFKLYPLVLVCMHICTSLGAIATDISRLRSDLLNGYDPLVRPVKNHDYMMYIHVNVLLYGFELDERSSTLNAYALTILTWWDEHLGGWDPSRYGNITKMQFAEHELWHPDITVMNNVDKSELDHFGNTPMTAFNSSLVYWVVPAKFQVGCTTDLRRWPYDTQNCTIVLSSWSYHGYEIDLDKPENISGIYLGRLTPNRDWDVVDTSFVKRVRYVSFMTGFPWPDLILGIKIARRSPVHSACIVAPGLVLAWAVLIAFWLPPGSSQRLLILLMAIAINAIYLFYIYSMIPNNGDNVPLVLLFYRDSMYMLAFALVWTISLRDLAETTRQSPVPLPGFIQVFLQSVPAKILCLDPRPSTGGRGGDSSGEGGESTGNPFGSGVEKGNPFQQDWAWLAHLLDRVMFVAYWIVYIIMFLALL